MFSQSLGSTEMVSTGTGIDSGQFMSHKGTIVAIGGGGGGAMGNGLFENWGDSGVVADHSQQTDTSTDTDDKNQVPVSSSSHYRCFLMLQSCDTVESFSS